MLETISVAFIGLGVMGFPMAGHLAVAGYQTTVFNRTGAKSEAWIERFDGQAAATPGEAAKQADVIFVCVGRDSDLREVMMGEQGILANARSGSIIVDHTTVSATIAREMADQAYTRGLLFLDAPVSGGQKGAEAGKLTVMVGGDQGAYSLVEPILKNAYALEMRYIGASGSGQMAKMVNQICIAGVLQGLSEGLNFGMKAGLDMDEVLNVITKGAAQSWQMENRGSTMLQDKFDFGFALDWMIKDLGIARDEALRQSIQLSMTEDILTRYQTLSDRGLGRMDTSALIKQFDG